MLTNEELIERLRVNWEGMGHMANAEREEAANAIAALIVERDVAVSRAMTKEREAHDLRKKSEKAHWELRELKNRYNKLVLAIQEFEARDVGGEA